MRVAANWSGGKDCCLACYEAVKRGYELSTLLNFVFRDYGDFHPLKFSKVFSDLVTDFGNSTPHKVSVLSSLALREVAKRTPVSITNGLKLALKTVSRATPHEVTNIVGAVNLNASRRMVPHEVLPEIVAMQAKAMGIPIIQRSVFWNTFDDEYRKAVRMLDREDFEGGIVWGMIPPDPELDHPRKMKKYMNLQVQYDWINQLNSGLGTKALMPLLEKTPEQILKELVANNFEVVIVVVNPEFVSEKWLGHRVDEEWINEIRRLYHEKGINMAGDEYHTFVLDCPLFKKRINILKSRKISKEGYSIFEISKAELVDKRSNLA